MPIKMSIFNENKTKQKCQDHIHFYEQNKVFHMTKYIVTLSALDIRLYVHYSYDVYPCLRH